MEIIRIMNVDALTHIVGDFMKETLHEIQGDTYFYPFSLLNDR